MLWLWVTLGVLIGLPLAVAGVGLLLDERHVASVTFRLAQPPGSVFAVIANPQEAASWRTDLKSVEVLPAVEGRVRFREHGRQGAALYEVVRSDPPRSHEIRIADDGLAYGGCWRFELTPDGGGTRVTITEDGFVKNPVFRVLSRTVFSLTGALEGYARALGVRFGEQVQPEVVLAHGGAAAAK
jgi:uncharacterized protein YndB with AHSA1/START domain